jgi:hypothetical protein
MKAEIHDLAMGRYAGERVAPARRYRAIARNVVGVAWRGKILTKIAVIASVAITLAAGVAMYVLRSQLFEMARMRGAQIPKAEQIVFTAEPVFELVAFVLALLFASAAIANDLRLGAFQFYFARAIRPRDYVVGKLLGLVLLIGIPMFAGPVALSLVRLVLADSFAQAMAVWRVVPQAIVLGVAGTAAYVLPAAGLGALAGKRQIAQAAFAIYYLVVCPALFGLSFALRLPWVRLVSVPSDLSVIGYWLFGLGPEPGSPPVVASAIALVVLCAAGLYSVWRRVDRAAHQGIGGA